MDCELLTTNAGGRLAHIDDQTAFMSGIDRDHPSWQILFIAEVDAKLATGDTSAYRFGGLYSVRRYWPGPGKLRICGGF